MTAKKNAKYAKFYMDIAQLCSEMSYAKRLKVGCVIVKDGRIISMGWNGMPKGMLNECEDSNGKTLPECMHAEENAILKLAKDGESSVGAVMFSTHSPCTNCARMIHGSGIRMLVYNENYRQRSGIDLLMSLGTPCFLLREVIEYNPFMSETRIPAPLIF